MTAFLLFLKTIPPARWAQLAVAAALLSVFAYMGVTIQSLHIQVAQAQTAQARAEKATETEKAGRAHDNALAQSDAASAAVSRLQQSAQLQDSQKEIEDAHQLIHAQGAAVAAANDVVARSLRDAFRGAAPAAPARGASGADPGSVAVGAAGAPARDLRADVFDEWEGRARTLEAALDDEYQRHDGCVAEYRNAQRASRSQLGNAGNALK